MTSQQLDEERIFHLARRQPDADAQAEYLDQVCAGDQALRERVEELLRVDEQDQSFLLYVLAFDCAYLLQRPDIVQDIIRDHPLQMALQPEWRWWEYVIDFHKDGSTEPELIAKAGPFSNAGAMANYAIAVKAMGNGDAATAKEYFRRTVATRRVGWWNYHWAKVYLQTP